MIAKSGSPAKKEGLAYLIYAASEKVGVEGFTIFLLESERVMGVSGWALEAAGEGGSKGSISGALKDQEKAKLWC
jgi:hypothetical protein